ncbi:hypothetical protein ABIB83_004705 [Bradyrhizobium sp. I1.8.5]
MADATDGDDIIRDAKIKKVWEQVHGNLNLPGKKNRNELRIF